MADSSGRSAAKPEGREGGTSETTAANIDAELTASEAALPSPACEAAGEGGRRPGGGQLPGPADLAGPPLPAGRGAGGEGAGGGHLPSDSTDSPSPNPTLPGSAPPSRACHGVAQRSRTKPQGRVADSSGRSAAKPEGREGGTSETTAADLDAGLTAPEAALPSPACGAAGEGGRRPGGGHLAIDGEPPSADLDPSTPLPPSFTPIDTSRGRFKRNVLANLIYFVFNAGIQLWFVRYLIDNLGVATYGLVPLATNITNYMAIITVALSGSVGRFLTIDLARGDLATANRTFNTSLFASIVLAVALVPVAGALSWFAPSFLDIPAGEEMGTRFLLMCTCFAFLLNAVGSNFACSTFAKNRFDVQRGIDAMGFVTQIGVVVTLFTWADGDLWYVGAGIAASAVVRQLAYQVSWRKLTPELSIRLASVDRTRLREILGMGGWLTVDYSGSMVQSNLALPLTNVLVGASAAGVYAMGLQWAMLIGAMASTALTALTPTLTAYHGRGDRGRVGDTALAAMRLLGLAMALPIGLVVGLSRPLAQAWVGPQHADLPALMALLTLPLIVQTGVRPLTSVYHAMNRVMWPGLMCWVVGLTDIAAAVAFARVWGLGVYGVAIAITAGWALKNATFTPLYAARILRLPPATFLPGLVPGLLASISVAVVSWLVWQLLPVHPWMQLLLALACTSMFYGLALYGVILRPEEKRLLGWRCPRLA